MPPLSPIDETSSTSSISASSRGSSSSKSQRRKRHSTSYSAAKGAPRGNVSSRGRGNNRDTDYDGSADDILALLGSPDSEVAETTSRSQPEKLPENGVATAAPVEGSKKVRFARSNAEYHRRAPPLHSSSSGGERDTSSSSSSGDGITPSDAEEPRHYQKHPANSNTTSSDHTPSASFDPITSRPDAASHHHYHHHHRPSSAVSSIFSRVGSSSDRGGDDRGYDRRKGQFDDHPVASSSSTHSTINCAADAQMIRTLKQRHQEEINAIVDKHREEMERIKKNEIQAQNQANTGGLLKDAVAALHSVAADLKSQQQKYHDEEIGAERTRLESLQMSLQRERERLLEVEDDERTTLMRRLESLETERLEHAQSYRKQQSELQKSRDDLERNKLEFAIRIQEIEEKLERKRESLARDKEHLIDSKEKLAQERADFDESRRMARTELQGADALRRESAEMQNNINTEAARLNTLKEQLEHETKALLDRESQIDARLVEAEKLDAKNAQTLAALISPVKVVGMEKWSSLRRTLLSSSLDSVTCSSI
mmetsp:Transcript_22404/g.64317  ORF Transcript_22404/g.64317 Transcript_22404/m.64317 type:complete len:541 (-) Transcript_22404:1368-2990(-)